MTTTKPKSKKTTAAAVEPVEIQPTIEPPVKKEAATKTTKKASTTKAIPATETKAAAETVVPVPEEKTPAKKRKPVKVKVIRDSFSFPEQDYLKISELKKSCLAAGTHVKKSELLRAGLQLLEKLSLDELKQAVDQVEKIKTGRPHAKNS